MFGFGQQDFGRGGGGFLNYNQLLNQLSAPQSGTLDSMAQQTMGAFGNAAALSSANMQAAYPHEAAMQIEKEKTNRMMQLLNSPLLSKLLGGAGGFTSNFGQSAGGQQPAPAPGPASNPIGPSPRKPFTY